MDVLIIPLKQRIHEKGGALMTSRDEVIHQKYPTYYVVNTIFKNNSSINNRDLKSIHNGNTVRQKSFFK